ncbi:MAG: carboxymuconolactone decarboxylase family protein [Imperialibacter sp.]
MSERLTPIEKPGGLMLRIAFWYSKRTFGKVITPLKKIYSRMPIAFGTWSGKISSLENKLPIPLELRILLRIHVAQLNGCHFCIDMGQAHAMQRFKDQEKFFTVNDFEVSPLFSDKERVALRFATEMTLHKKVGDDTYDSCRSHYSDEQMLAIAWMVTSEHVYNLMNLTFEVESDGLCQLQSNKSLAINN